MSLPVRQLNPIATLPWNLGIGAVRKGRSVLVIDRDRSALVKHVLEALADRQPRINRYYLGGGSEFGCPVLGISRPLPFDGCRLNMLRRLRVGAVIASAPEPADLAILQAAEVAGVRTVTLDHSLNAAELDALVEALAGAALTRVARPEASAAIGRWFFDRAFREMAGLSELADRLGNPQTIICLGNGPSSEDPSLGEVGDAALFRANHLWRERGYFLHPEVVFTGQTVSVRACGTQPFYVFPSMKAQEKIARLAWTLPGKRSYLNAEKAHLYDPEAFAPFKPTNGAVMLAVAVALKPRRLVVAGIDLFSDPRGAYAGANAAANAYTPAHERTLEAQFILATLRSYEGELVLVGEVLRKMWQDDQTQRAR